MLASCLSKQPGHFFCCSKKTVAITSLDLLANLVCVANVARVSCLSVLKSKF